MEQNTLSSTTPEQERLIQEFQKEGYQEIRIDPQTGKFYCINRFLFTWAILADLHSEGYEDRWCYNEYCEAKGALDDWEKNGFTGEPEGWHRHPTTGRRKDQDGNEYINY